MTRVQFSQQKTLAEAKILKKRHPAGSPLETFGQVGRPATPPQCLNRRLRILHLRHWGGKVGRGRLHARMAVDERFGLGLDRMVVFSVWACCERGPVVMSGRRINDDKAPSAPDRQVGASLGQSDSKGAVREEHAGGRAD